MMLHISSFLEYPKRVALFISLGNALQKIIQPHDTLYYGRERCAKITGHV